MSPIPTNYFTPSEFAKIIDGTYTDPNAQALLEIYCTFELDAKYNDFDTH